jgi:HSP20 family protein
MPIIKWNPWEQFGDLDRFFEEGAGGFVPALDIYQTKDAVVVETPLAGIDPEDVEISIENDVLTVNGKTERQSEVDEKNFYRKEVRYGSFHRSVRLPVAVLGGKAEAKSENGMLKITIPKSPEAKSKAIKVKVVKGKK